MNKIDSELERVHPWIRLTSVHVPDFSQKPVGNFLSRKFNFDVNTNIRLDRDYKPSTRQVPRVNSYPEHVVDIRTRKPQFRIPVE